jgi:ATP-dependent exoDNAse (exonuclease V) beta subunit
VIKFIEDSHQYISQEGKELISVSKFTELFKQKVDWKKIAERVAKKKSKESDTHISTKDILDKWANKRDHSAKVGTLYHSIREQELLESNNPVFYDRECSLQACHHDEFRIKYSIPINNLQNNTVYPELMIYDTDFMICGQSDKVIVIDNKIHIWDYKTDEEIKFKGYYNQWQPPKRLLPPLDHLDECNGNLYSIKMSLYMYLLWKANKGRFLPGDIIIEHVSLERDPENDNIPVIGEDGRPVVLDIQRIELPYRKKEVIAMLSTLKPRNDT